MWRLPHLRVCVLPRRPASPIGGVRGRGGGERGARAEVRRPEPAERPRRAGDRDRGRRSRVPRPCPIPSLALLAASSSSRCRAVSGACGAVPLRWLALARARPCGADRPERHIICASLPAERRSNWGFCGVRGRGHRLQPCHAVDALNAPSVGLRSGGDKRTGSRAHEVWWLCVIYYATYLVLLLP